MNDSDREDHGFQMKTEMNEAKDNLRKVMVCLALALRFGTALLFCPVLTFDFMKLDDPALCDQRFPSQPGPSLGKVCVGASTPVTPATGIR